MLTDELYEKVLAGLKSTPERHYVIGGRTAYSIAQLEEICKVHNYTPKGAAIAVAEPVKPRHKTQVQTSGKADPAPKPTKGPVAAPPTAPPTAAVAIPPAAQSADGSKDAPAATKSAADIPDNLLTLSYGQLRTLAKELGVSPVPNGQTELIAAIKAKQDGPD